MITRTFFVALGIVAVVAGCSGSEDSSVADASAVEDASGMESTADSGPCQIVGDSCNGGQTAMCCPLFADMYAYDVSKGCRTQTAVASSTPNECFATGMPGNQACKLYSMQTCFSRTNPDGTVTVAISQNDYPSGYVDSTGMTKCESAFKQTFEAAPACTK